MSSNRSAAVPLALGLLAASFAATLASHGAGLMNRLNEIKSEAVKRGYAEYTIDAMGDTTWKWKESK